jgi:hypothetical protein
MNRNKNKNQEQINGTQIFQQFYMQRHVKGKKRHKKIKGGTTWWLPRLHAQILLAVRWGGTNSLCKPSVKSQPQHRNFQNKSGQTSVVATAAATTCRSSTEATLQLAFNLSKAANRPW